MRIHAIRIENYGCIESLDEAIGEHGAIICGPNGRGKTTVLRAVRALLIGRGISADAIKIDSDEGRAKLSLDLDHHTVRRVISRNGNSDLTVRNSEGDTKAKPANWLMSIFATAIDPLELYLAKPKERRATILAAMPMTISVEQLRQHAPELSTSFDVSGHALEVIARARKIYYDARTDMNARAKLARGEVDHAEAAAVQFETAVVPGAPTLADAVADLDRAKATVARLESQNAQALSAIERNASTVATIEELRTKAQTARAAMKQVTPDALTGAMQRLHDAHAITERLRSELAVAELTERECGSAAQTISDALAQNQACQIRASDLEAQAAQLETAVAKASVAPVDASAFDVARQAVEIATEQHRAAETVRAATAARAKVELLAKGAREVEAEAERLHRVVDALTNDLPKALFAQHNAIPGLSLDGDEVLLDGKRLDSLSGAEQLQLCTDVACRGIGEGRVITVDGLERLDPVQFVEFCRDLRRKKVQLLGTRVTDGDLRLEVVPGGEDDATGADWSAE